MAHLKKFASIEEAVGTVQKTPFVAIVAGCYMPDGKTLQCLIVSKKRYGDSVTIVRNEERNFIDVGDFQRQLFTLDVDHLDDITRYIG
jgi:hypothetical protein